MFTKNYRYAAFRCTSTAKTKNALPFLFFVTFCLMGWSLNAQIIAAYGSANSPGNTASAVANASATPLSRGAGITPNSGGTFNSNGWDEASAADAILNDDYIEWSIAANSGFVVNIFQIDLRYDRSGTGPDTIFIRSSLDSFSTDLFTDNSVSDPGEDNLHLFSPNLKSAPGDTIIFRLYGFGASSSGGTFDIETLSSVKNGLGQTDAGIELTGSVVPVPTAICQDTVIYLNASGLAVIDSTFINNSSNAPAGLDSMVVSPDTFDCSLAGQQSLVRLIVFDVNGNSDTCAALVTISDTLSPSLTCPGDIILSCPDTVNYELLFSDCTGSATAAPSDSILPNYFKLGSFGNSVYYLSNSFQTGPNAFLQAQANGYQLVTINSEAENDYLIGLMSNTFGSILIGLNDVASEGNFEWQSGQMVSFTDWRLGEPNGGADWDYVILNPFTPSGWLDVRFDHNYRYLIEFNDGPVQISGLPSGSVFSGDTVVNTFFLADTLGNSDTCSFTVIAPVDTTAPVFTSCPGDTVFYCGNVVNYNPPTAFDDCDFRLTQIKGQPSGSVFVVGVDTIIFVASDAAGNSDTCSFTITVIDTVPPTLSACPSDITLTNDPAQCGELINYATPTFSDDCGTSTSSRTMNFNTPSCGSPDNYREAGMTMFGDDHFHVGCGAEGDCLDDGTIYIHDDDVARFQYGTGLFTPQSVQICHFPDSMTFTAFPSGATFTPSSTGVVNFPNTADWQKLTSMTWANNSENDDLYIDNFTFQPEAGVVQVAGLPSGSLFPVGVTQNIFVAVDFAGNADTCGFAVTINDTVPPVITCPADTIVDIDSGICGAVVNYPLPEALDNCNEFDATLENIRANFNANFANITSLIPNRFDFSDGENGTDISDGGDDMYDGGNELSTNLSSGLIPYSNDSINYTDDFGDSTGYFTRKVPGLFFLAADMKGVSEFEITGDLGADGNGAVDGFEALLNVGSGFNIFVKRVFDAGDPSVNHLIIIPKNEDVEQDFDFDGGDDDDHEIFNLQATTRLYYLLYASANGGYIDDAQTIAIAEAFLNETGADMGVVQIEGLASGKLFPKGPTKNIFVVTDESGNTDTCSFTVTVNDTATVPTCPVDISVENDADTCGAIVFFDICGPSTVVLSDTSGSFFPAGSTIVTVTDTSDSSSCSFTINVIDTIAPAIDCPTDITVFQDMDTCGAFVTYPKPTGSDNCELVSRAVFNQRIEILDDDDDTNSFSFAVDSVGSDVEVTFRAIGDMGSSSEVWVFLDENGNRIARLNDGDDDCDVLISQTVTVPLDTFNTWVLDNVVNFTAIDSSGNIDDFCDENYVEVSFEIPDTGATFVQITGLPSESFFPVGNTVNTFYARDVAGNTDTCSFTVTVLDTTRPVAVCQNITVFLDDNGEVGVAPAQLDGGSSDDCPLLFNISGASPSVKHDSIIRLGNGDDGQGIGFNPVDGLMYHSSGDGSGEEYFEPVNLNTLTVGSNLAPGNTFPSSTFTDDITGLVYYPPLNGFVVMDRDYNIVLVRPDLGTFTYLSNFNGSEYLRGFAVVGSKIYGVDPFSEDLVEFDPNTGNVISTVSVVIDGNTISNGSNGLATNPTTGDVYIIFKGGGPGRSLGIIDVTTGIGTEIGATGRTFAGISFDGNGNLYGISGQDRDPTQTLFKFQTQLALGCEDIGDTTITLVVSDPSGNSDSCQATITVKDTLAPVLGCPTEIIVSQDADTCGALVEFMQKGLYAVNGGANDGSPAGGAFMSLDEITGAGTVIGTPVPGTSLTSLAQDTSGTVYAATSNGRLIVIDPSTGGLISEIGSFNATVRDMAVHPGTGALYGVADNINTNTIVTINKTTAALTVVGTPAINSNYLAIGFAPDSALYGMQQFGTNDLLQLNPNTGAIMNQTVVSTSLGAKGLGVDESGMIYISECCNNGNGNNIWTIDPSNGNATLLGSAGSGRRVQDISFLSFPIGAIDNCDGAVPLVYSQNPGTFFPVGTTTVNVTANDANGNSSICSFDVTVVDTSSGGVVTCPANITQSSDADTCGAIVTFAASTTASCGPGSVVYSQNPGTFFPVGTTTVFATTPDSSSSCSFDITVIDTTPPVVMCPANITMDNDADTCGANVSFAATAMESCGGVTFTYSPDTGSFFPVGTTTVNVTATDTNGNVDTCSFLVTVNDTTAPEATCPNDIVVINDPDTCGADVFFSAQSPDNCASVSYSFSHNPGDFFPIGATKVSVTASDTSGNSDTCSFMVTVQGSQISVFGGGETLTDGQSTTSPNDSTDFGQTNVFSTTTHGFYVVNDGNGVMNVSSVQITGTNAAQFSVGQAGGAIAPGDSQLVNIDYAPIAAGNHTARVEITTDACDISVFDFAIFGTTLVPAEIEVSGNGQNITDGQTTISQADSTDFDSTGLGEPIVHQFIIENTGGSDLVISDIMVVGSGAGAFTVSPNNGTVPAGNQASIQVTFNPQSIGTFTADVQISSNDADENPFTFAIEGRGFVNNGACAPVVTAPGAPKVSPLCP